MSEISHSPAQSSYLSNLHQPISVMTWLATLLLSLRGLFEFYGMKSKGSFEHNLGIITEPMVQLFSFSQIENLNIPGISVLFATITILLISYSLRISIKYFELRNLRVHRTLVRQTISLPSE